MPTGTCSGLWITVDFPSSAPGESFGRFPNGTGRVYPMLAVTLESANGLPRVGPVIVSQIHYNPDGADEKREFLVLTNTGTESEVLTGWRVAR